MKWKRWLIPFALWLLALPAAAHSLSVSYLELAAEHNGTTRIELDVAVRELALRLPIDANRNEIVTWGEIEKARSQIESWAMSGLTLTSTPGDCALSPRGLAIRRYDTGAHIALGFASTCKFGGSARLQYALFFNEDPKHRAIVTVRDGGKTDLAILTTDARTIRAGGGQAGGQGGEFVRFLREGVHHILIGYDHLAFLLSLLLPAALVRDGGCWLPVQNARDGFSQVLGIVTAFTLAHSITLGLAALGWVRPASRWVESAIAASVVLAALNNLRPLVVHRLWLAGFGFGLIHGFGFAGALSELGLGGGIGALALLGFNLGVELGQLAVVSVVLPILLLLRAERWYRNTAMPALSLAIAGAAFFWLSQRLTG